MAKDLGDLIVRLSLNSANFDDGIKRLESGMVKIQTSFKSSTTGLTNFDKVTGKLQTSASTLTERLRMQEQTVSQLEKAYEESVRTKGADAEETQKLAAKLQDAKGKLDQTKSALGLVNEQIKLNQNGWYQLGVNLEGVGTKLQSVGTKMSSVGTKMSIGLTAPIAALGTKVVKAGIDFESAFAGVKKTVEETCEGEFAMLSESLKEMSERIPATTTDLAGIMELAGQLGVRGAEDLTKFTEVIAALGVSTNLTTEEAATMLAQFANITGMDYSDIDKLGSVIVALGNNFATTEADITRMGQRLAAAGSQIGMTEPQIMAFATALSSVGIEAEAGGTAFSKLMKSMKVAAETGTEGNKVIQQTGMSLRDLTLLADQDGKAFKELASSMGMTTGELRGYMSAASDLDNFAKVAGMTAEQFASKYRDDATGAIMAFLEGLNKIEADGGSAIVTLNEMGITEQRLSDAILRAAGSTDLFGAAQELANTAWGENIALQTEAEQRYATTESQLQMLKNAANNLAIEFSAFLMPALLSVVEKLKGVIEWAKNLSDEKKELIVKIAAVVAAFGPMLAILGKVTSGIGSFMKFLAPLAKALGGSKTAVGLLGKAFTALTGPIGIIVAVVAGLIAIFVTLYNTNEDFRNKVNAIWAQICAAFENVKEAFEKTFQRIVASMEPVKEALGRLWETVSDVFLQVWNLVEPIVSALGVIIGSLVTIVIAAANGILNCIGPLIEAIVNGVDFVMNILGVLIALLNGDVTGAFEMLKNAAQSLGDFFINIFQTLINFFVGFWEGLCAVAEGFGVNLNAFFSGLWEGIKAAAVAIWTGITSWLSTTWDNIKSTAVAGWEAIKTGIVNIWNNCKTAATTIWNAVCTNIQNAVNTGKTWITNAWNNVKTAVSGVWDTVKTGATTAWNTITTNVKNAVDGAKSGIQTAWTTISSGISSGWDSFKTTASTAWSTITGNVKSAIDGAKSGITSAWDSIKSGVKGVWDGVLEVIKSPITSASTWLSEKVEWFKGLFNFQWKLPEFKLPKINVKWKEIGWGISLPTLSVSWNAKGGLFDKPTIFATSAGLQGVGEAGPEAVLPLNTLWDEMGLRVKAAMREILAEAEHSRNVREDALIGAVMAAIGAKEKDVAKAAAVQVTQNIYANQTSYVGQQREAARNFRQIARALG